MLNCDQGKQVSQKAVLIHSQGVSLSASPFDVRGKNSTDDEASHVSFTAGMNMYWYLTIWKELSSNKAGCDDDYW